MPTAGSGYATPTSGATEAGNLIGLPNVTALRNHPGGAAKVVQLRGYTNPNDADQGLFQWDPNADTDDGTTRFNSGGLGSSSAGWKRVYNGAIDVSWAGAVGDSTTGTNGTDDTVAIQRAIDAAIALGNGIVFFQSGKNYRVTDTITIPASVTLRGDGAVAGGTQGIINNFATVSHDFDGDLFVFNGAVGSAPTSGGGIDNLRIVQTFGGLADGIPRGTAVLFTGADPSHRANWPKVRGAVIEENGNSPWTYCLVLDGHDCDFIPNFWIDNTSCHISTGGTAALRLNKASGRVLNCEFHLGGANIIIGDVDETSSCQLTSVDCFNLILDHATDFTYIGGIATSITTTANVSGKCTIIPGRLVTPFGSTANSSFGVWQFVEGVQYWRANASLVVPNNFFYYGRDFAGTGNIIIASVDLTNSVRIGDYSGGGSGAVFVFGGTAARFRTSTTNAEIADEANHVVVEVANGNKLAFYGGTPGTKPTVSGVLSAVVDPNAQAVMGSIITTLANLGLITDGTT